MGVREVVAEAAVFTVRVVMFVYDVVTLPLFMAVYRPWAKVRAIRAPRTRVVGCTDSSVTIETIPYSSRLKDEILALTHAPDTMDELFAFAVERNRGEPMLGSRKVLGEEQTDVDVQGNSKKPAKLLQGDYKWESYEDVEQRVVNVARGLRVTLSVAERDMIVIYADTRADWLLTALACFKNNITVVTLYTNLGEDGIVAGITQSKARTLITSQELLERIGKLLPRIPDIVSVMYFENRTSKTNMATGTFPQSMKLVPFSQVETCGAASLAPLTPPSPKDVAVLMYTSGSTGKPKGALINHAHLATAVIACLPLTENLLGENRGPEHGYLAYLPLAHIFELTMEIVVALMGIKIGYSSPGTLTDASPMVAPGQRGDMVILQPTAMVAVPVILDRIYRGIRTKICQKGVFFQKLFDSFCRYRQFWRRWGMDTPLLKRLVFSKLRKALGGNLRLIVSGGAPLSPHVHDFLRTSICDILPQGYGLTETTGGISLSDIDDLGTGTVGHPLPGVKVCLEDWEEGGYTTTDPGGPKGEVSVGCSWVSSGYFPVEEQSQEGFWTTDDGMRWFRTGDIGHIVPGLGTLSIIDRKKDLVKLQLGEYVSLGKVESVLKSHPLVESVCIYAESSWKHTVALLVPDEVELRKLNAASKSGRITNGTAAASGRYQLLSDEGETSRKHLCSQEEVIRNALDTLTAHAKGKLERFEIPRALVLIPESWTPETGLVTASMKIRRRQIKERYKDIIHELHTKLERSDQ